MIWIRGCPTLTTTVHRGDEFALLALCQMYTRHAIIVTSNQTWTSVHPKHNLDNQDLRRNCDLHLIYLGGETFGILKPKFEWKVEIPIGHMEVAEPPDKTLQDKTDEILSKEASVNNIADMKEEPVGNITQLSAELSDVTSPLPSGELPDATRNLIVALPPDMQLNLDTDIQTPTTMPEPNTTPCSVKLIRCDAPTTTPTSHIEVNVIVKNRSYDLRPKNIISGNKATSTTRSRHSASRNISYIDLFRESSS